MKQERFAKRSIKTRILALVLFAVIMTVLLLGYVGADRLGRQADASTASILNLSCSKEAESINHIFDRVDLSVKMCGTFAADILGSSDRAAAGAEADEYGQLRQYMENVAGSTDECLSYYFIAQEEEKGFFYTLNVLDESYVSQESVMLESVDVASWLVYSGDGSSPDWTQPHQYAYSYAPIISCIMPVSRQGSLIGYVGMDVNFQDIADSIGNDTGYETGTAFLMSRDGDIYYHRYLETGTNLVSENPEEYGGLTDYFASEDKENMTFDYTYRGVAKSLAAKTLTNGMELCLAVERSEIDTGRRRILRVLLPVAVIVGLIFAIIAIITANRITKPLIRLTAAARKVAGGDMNDIELDTDRNDEIGELSATFSGMVDYLRIYIRDAERDAYVDKLTGVKNAKAYRNSLQGLEEERRSDEELAFGIAMFDLNDLKKVNDTCGHEEGNIYIKNACRLISRTFKNSPVFRIGGDEFVAILRNYDFEHFQELGEGMVHRMNEINEQARNIWEEVHIAMGFAFYHKSVDSCVEDVFRRADEAMYRNKRAMKNGDVGDIDR